MRLVLLLILLLFSRLYALSHVDQLLSEASVRNAYFLYGDAVKLLDEAIERNPHEKELYKEPLAKLGRKIVQNFFFMHCK